MMKILTGTYSWLETAHRLCSRELPEPRKPPRSATKAKVEVTAQTVEEEDISRVGLETCPAYGIYARVIVITEIATLRAKFRVFTHFRDSVDSMSRVGMKADPMIVSVKRFSNNVATCVHLVTERNRRKFIYFVYLYLERIAILTIADRLDAFNCKQPVNI